MAYIGVIRGDMQGPIAIMDLETVSQYNPPTEPRGQERRVGRPNAVVVGAALSAVPAGIAGTTNISAGATIGAGNKVLRAKVASAASFTVVTLVEAAYASGTALAAAVNAALATAGLAATAFVNSAGRLVLQSNVGGTGSFIAIDTTGAGSTFNGAVGFAGGGSSFTMPAASAIITALLPPGGPLDMSAATLLTNIGSGGSTTQRDALIGTIAPRFVETPAFIQSFQVGMISGYRGSTYNPDPSRLPALTPGAAISVVQDDGSTPFVAPLTVITAAVHSSPSANDLTITGTNLGNSEWEQTVVKVESADGSRSVKIYQKVIQRTLSAGTQGVVTATSIVIPASLLAGLSVAGAKVRVQYASLASNLFTVT